MRTKSHTRGNAIQWGPRAFNDQVRFHRAVRTSTAYVQSSAARFDAPYLSFVRFVKFVVPLPTHHRDRTVPPREENPHTRKRDRWGRGRSTIRCVFTGQWGRLHLCPIIRRPVRRTLPFVRFVKFVVPLPTHHRDRTVPPCEQNHRTRGNVIGGAAGVQRSGAFSPGSGDVYCLCPIIRRPVRRTLPFVRFVKFVVPLPTHHRDRRVPPREQNPAHAET
jgi:hypothetical protein